MEKPKNQFFQDLTKFNFDGLVMVGSTVARGFLKNSMGEFVVAYTRNFGGASINKMEVLALSWGFIIARARGINRLAIKGDSM